MEQVVCNLREIIREEINSIIDLRKEELRGERGYSSYELAVQNGYKGSVMDYLEVVGNCDLRPLTELMSKMKEESKRLRKAAYRNEELTNYLQELIYETDAIKKTLISILKDNDEMKEVIHTGSGRFLKKEI